MSPLSQNRRRRSEEGYMLVVVIFMLAILVLSLSIAVPRVRESIQRDREEETMQRGKQYIRAVQLYYRKFNAYPPNVDALVKTNNIRFLRKKYVDPTTGKDEWKSIMYCQNKTPQAMGFFGQPLAGTGCGAVAGIGPGGGNNGINGPSSGIGGVNTSPGGGIFSNNPSTPNTPGAGTTGAQSGAGGTDANGNPISGTGTSGTGTSGTGSAFGSSNNPTGNGQSFGGGGIIGFSPQSPKQSLMVYKKKNHYNEWEFLYSPLMDQQNMAGGNTGMIGQPAGGTTTPIGGTGTTPIGGTGTTPVGGTGTTTPTPPTTPTTPQQ
jgi:type II secretory pathway pseudopilin PulG